VKVGDLVRNTRASIGIPKNTIGLIMKHTWIDHHDDFADADSSLEGLDIWFVLYCVDAMYSRTKNRIVRRVTQDLEVVKNESR
jgi:hypothetical protein